MYVADAAPVVNSIDGLRGHFGREITRLSRRWANHGCASPFGRKPGIQDDFTPIAVSLRNPGGAAQVFESIAFGEAPHLAINGQVQRVVHSAERGGVCRRA